MNDTYLFIVVGVIGIGIGFAVGMLVNSLRSGQTENEQKEQPKPDTHNKPKPDLESDLKAFIQSTSAQTEKVQQSQDQVPTRRPNLNPLDVFARALQPSNQSTHPHARSIAEQVDEILQEMLENSPLRSKAIRLLELPQKGMVVMVGLEQYQGVEAVPDEEIRNLIRTAVVEWEQRVSEVSQENVQD